MSAKQGEKWGRHAAGVKLAPARHQTRQGKRGTNISTPKCVGFISSDAAGKRNIARTYWANPDTGLVSDEPQESWLYPKQWGTWILE